MMFSGSAALCLLSDCDDECSKTVFIPLHAAVNNVMSGFYQYIDNYLFWSSCFIGFISLSFIIISSSTCMYLPYLFSLSAFGK